MRPHGESILEIVRSVPSLPPMFLTHGVVCINGEIVPRDMWAMVRPKATSEHVPVNVTLHFPLQGGKGSSSKSILGIVAAIALIAITAFILGPGGAALITGAGLPLTIGGISTASVIAGAVGLAGALAISALTAPPTVNDNSLSGGENSEQKESAGASANIIDPGGAIPRVLGTRKIYPPLIAEPIVQMIAGDEFVEAVYGLNGPHDISDIRIDGASIDSVDDVDFETREGWDTDTALTLVTRYGRSATPNIQLTQHQLRTDGFTLIDQATPANSLPIFHRIVGRRGPDEMWLQFVLPAGIVDANALSNARAIPIRIRMRIAGAVPGAWINLPELHLSSLDSKQLRKTIYFHWNTQTVIATPPNPATQNYGWTAAYNEVPGQTATPTDAGTQWEANDYFDNGNGAFSQALTFGTVASSRIINVDLAEHDVDIYLNDTVFPRGVVWEFEIMRGYAFVRSSLTYSTYSYAGSVKNFFKYINNAGSLQLTTTQQSVVSTLVAVRLVSVWYAAPVQTTGFALVAIRARNRNLTRVSCVAKGYVQDWDGANWATWTTTSNAAPHYRDVLRGDQNLDPLDATLVDDSGLVNWRSLCAVNDWRCDLIVDDMRTQDVLSAIASTSYARPYQSDIYGVTVDSNRANDAPVQIFSRVNSRGMHWDKAFARIPQGFIVTYRDEATDNDRAQTIVDQADPEMATTGLYESVSYDGIVNVDKVRTRARFDLDQANMRSIFYQLETDLEALMCRRGSLVGMQTEIITSFSGEGRVVTKNRSAGNVLSLTLDSKVTIPSSVPNAVAGISSRAISDLGISDFASVTVVPMGIAIRRSDGTVTVHRITNGPGETDTLVFETPIPDDASVLAFQDSDINYRHGSMVTWGPIGTEYRRMLVQAITPGKDLTATLTLVDEAPYLNRNTPP